MTTDKRRFAAAWLRSFDPQQAAQEVGGDDGIRLLTTPGVQREIALQRAQFELRREDVLRQLARLAFGRANDCVKLALCETAALDTLELSLLTEIRRNEKGTVEIRLLDRLAALRLLLEACSAAPDCAQAFFAACADEDGEAS